LTLLYILLIVLAMQLVSFYLTQRLEEYYLDEAKWALLNSGSLAVESLQREFREGPYPRDLAEQVVNSLRGRDEESIILLVAEDGEVVATSLNNAAQSYYGLNILAFATVAETLDIERRDTSEGIRTDEGGRRYYTAALPLEGELLVDGTVVPISLLFVQEPLDHTYRVLQDVRMRLLNATLLAIVVTAILGVLAAQTIIRPIQEVTSKAARLAEGNFDLEVKVKSPDEIGKLADVFNYLTAQLRATLSELNNDKMKLEAILTQMTNGVVAIDSHGKIIHANIRARDMLDLPPEGADIGTILTKLNQGSLDRLLIGSGPKVAEVSFTEPQAISVRSYAAPFHAADGQISGAIIVLQDITEEERLEQMRREFVANVSHELRTPLTTIKSYAETLLEGGLESRETSGRFVSVINDEADRMARLVKDLLTLSQFDFQGSVMSKGAVLLDELILDVADKLAMSARRRNLRFGTDFPEELPAVLANSDKVEQVLVNILSNAIKYTNEGSDIAVGLRVQQGFVVTSIRDQGPGIPEEDQPRIFERFYRVEKARARELGGTGLGLSIAKQIVEAHGGQIGINSVPGQGTEIYFTLPVYVPPAEEMSDYA
jgi:two-component system sensor histidine kinase VicK